MFGDKKGFVGIITKIIGLAIGLVMIANVAIPQVFNANTTAWDAGTIAIWNVIGIALAGYAVMMIFS